MAERHAHCSPSGVTASAGPELVTPPSAKSGEPVLACQGLTKRYRMGEVEVVALAGVDFALRAGELLVLLGASGSGKSTLLNILGGLDAPSAGTARVGSYDLTRMSWRDQMRYRRQQVGFVWQQTARNLVPYLTAQENVEMPMALNGVNAAERRQRARTLLDQVGLSERYDHRPDQLSGGQQQRVAIAIAMANHPGLLLADEPTGQIDAEAADSIFDAMRQINEAYQVTIIIVTHDVTIATRVNRVLGMRDGRIISEVLRQNQQAEGQEFAVLDRGGRLQLPDDFLEKLGLDHRVQVEVRENHVEVYPEGKR